MFLGRGSNLAFAQSEADRYRNNPEALAFETLEMSEFK
jgi:hypothetical protein